jgi:hypothetical protein
VNCFRALPLFLVAVLGFGRRCSICGLVPNFALLLLGHVNGGIVLIALAALWVLCA